jgi:Protein of unknown function (DUF3263)
VDLVVNSQLDAAEPPAESGEPAEEPALELSDRDRAMLAFERQWWSHAGAKEQAIRETFQLTGTRYYQLLNELLEKRAAMEAEPVLVKRLRGLRTTRQRARTAKRQGVDKR